MKMLLVMIRVMMKFWILVAKHRKMKKGIISFIDRREPKSNCNFCVSGENEKIIFNASLNQIIFGIINQTKFCFKETAFRS